MKKKGAYGETKAIKKSEKASDKKMGSKPPMKPTKKGK